MASDIRSQILAKSNVNPYGSGCRSPGRFGSSGQSSGRGRRRGSFGRGSFGRGRGRSCPPECRVYSHVSKWLALPEEGDCHVYWTENSYYETENDDADKPDSVGEIIAKTHHLSVSHHDQLQDHEERIELIAKATNTKRSLKELSIETTKGITKAIAQSLKKNLPKLSSMHAGHHMYLMRDNPKRVLEQSDDNEWTYKGYINKMHKWSSDDDDDPANYPRKGLSTAVALRFC